MLILYMGRLLDQRPSKPYMHKVKLMKKSDKGPVSSDEVGILIGGQAGEGAPLVPNHVVEVCLSVHLVFCKFQLWC